MSIARGKVQPLAKLVFSIALAAVVSLAMSMLASRANAAAETVELSGIFFRPDDASSAIFTLPNKAQKLVREGRQVIPGITVRKITTNSVQLDDNGIRRWINFKGATQTKTVVEPTTDNAPNFKRLSSKKDPVYRERMLLLRSSLERQTGGARRGYLIKDEQVFSLLHGAALQKGDVIKSVNGNGFSRSEDLGDFAFSWHPRARYIYTVLRDGQILELSR